MRNDGVVLLVDPEHDTLVMFEEVLGDSYPVVPCTDFVAARQRLLACPPALLVTNLRLDAYNGLHLAYLAASLGSSTRCIVYSDQHDPLLTREVHSAGAVYESKQRVLQILASYANAKLPAAGERNPLAIEQLQLLEPDPHHAS
jgi:DNA-binding NtrC family response regulator